MTVVDIVINNEWELNTTQEVEIGLNSFYFVDSYVGPECTKRFLTYYVTSYGSIMSF